MLPRIIETLMRQGTAGGSIANSHRTNG
jgi:hypothetical protein